MQETLRKEEQLQINYESLPKKYREVTNSAQFEQLNVKLQSDIDALTQQLEKIVNPNLNAINKLDTVTERLKNINNEFELAREAAKRIAEEFNEIKAQRYDKFMEAFNVISGQIDKIYKDLTKSKDHPGGMAFLSLEDSAEPYRSGVRYTAMPPKKRFRDIDQLSGGEKTLAALALLFSLHSFNSAPFFILDEIDAALDIQNVNRVARYLKQRSETLQCLVISLKDLFFEKADALIGVYHDEQTSSSHTLSLDLLEHCGPPE